MSLTWRLRSRLESQVATTSNGNLSRASAVTIGAALVLSGCSSLGLDSLGSFGRSDSAQDDNFNSRIYAGAGVLASQIEPDAGGDELVSLDEKQSVGGTLLLGYDISNRFSIEGHGSDLGEATFSPAGDIGYQVGGISALVYGLNDADDRSRREGFSMFGRLGVGTMRNQASGVKFKRVNDYHLLAGIGAEYGFGNGLGVRAELVSHDTDARYGQLGLVYRFGGAAGGVTAPAVAAPEAPSVSAVPSTTQPLTGNELDSDLDGVMDSVDQCLGSAAGSPVSADGCELFNGVIDGVNFESGSDKLTTESQAILTDVANTLNQNQDVRISIEAHTDNQGSAQSNLQLSKRRAISVARFLVQQGIAGNRLRPQAYGESKPVQSNSTAAGRERNRRVEFKVVN